MALLVLVRHGQSEWNTKGLWTGKTDVPLSEQGRQDARNVASLIKEIPIHIVYTSILKRAKETYDEIAQALQLALPVTAHEALNERDYGDLTGMNKWEYKEKYGEEQFMKMRRSWNVRVPNGESLEDVYNRVIPYFKDHILTHILRDKNVLIVAHGNSLRSLVKYLDNISDDDIPNHEVAIGAAYVYTIDKQGNVTNKEVRQDHAKVP